MYRWEQTPVLSASFASKFQLLEILFTGISFKKKDGRNEIEIFAVKICVIDLLSEWMIVV